MFIGFGREVFQLRLFKRELFCLEQMDLSSKTSIHLHHLMVFHWPVYPKRRGLDRVKPAFLDGSVGTE